MQGGRGSSSISCVNKMKRNSIDGDSDDGNNNSRKRTVPCRSTEDIISTLPCHIVNNILVCLPIQDAARTSVLSRNWRFKWLSISQLVFECDTNELFRSRHQTSTKIVWSLICQILLVHRGPLHKLVLDVEEEVKNTSTLLDQIILFLNGKDIQEFTLYPPIMETTYALPSTLFLCVHLTRLHLLGCIFRLPREYIGFNKLVSVQLDSVDFTADDFKTFLSKCPLLQRLNLYYCKKGNPIEIDAPNLKFLYFDCPEMSILFKNVPVLSKVKFVQSARLLRKSTDIQQVFDSLPAIEYFSIGESFVKDLTVGGISEKRPEMNHLKSVELSGLRFNSSKEVQFALFVITSSPNLHKLKIKILKCDRDVDDIPFKSLCLDEGLFNPLRQVIMEDFVGTMRELEFIEFLLAKSLLLKKIIILPPKESSDKEHVQILKSLIQFPRASTKAQIIFLDNGKDLKDKWDE